MPIVDKYKDMGMVVMGKVEAGEARKGQSLLLMPNRVSTMHLSIILLKMIFYLYFIAITISDLSNGFL